LNDDLGEDFGWELSQGQYSVEPSQKPTGDYEIAGKKVSAAA